MKVGLDVMGGDFAPNTTLDGAILAHKYLLQHEIVLIGPEFEIKKGLQERNIPVDTFEIINAADVIAMNESPAQAFKAKPDSSIAVGFNSMKNGLTDAFCSAGNTGAMLVGAVFTLGTVEGIERPVTPAILPRLDGGTNVVLDVGTNVECKPAHLLQFAVLGDLYARYVLNNPCPKIGLLNIGEEKEKGNSLTREAYQLLEQPNPFEFVGNVEGRDLFGNKADVFVCDGFVGNVVLKQAESFYAVAQTLNINHPYFDRFDYRRFGGTPILGVDGTVLVGHGVSDK